MPNTQNTTDPESHLRSLARETDSAAADPADDAAPAGIEEWRPGAARDDAASEAPAETPTPAPGATGAGETSSGTAAVSSAATPPPEAPSPAEPTPEAEATARREEFERAWQQTVAEETQHSPELKNNDSALSRAVQQILQETPLFTATPEGFRHAATLARARSQAAAIPELQARIAALTKENQRLARLTSITGSPPARPSHAPEELSERDLRRMARDVDAGFYA